MYYKLHVLFVATFMLVFGLGCSNKTPEAREAKIKAALETPEGKAILQDFENQYKALSQLPAGGQLQKINTIVDNFIRDIAENPPSFTEQEKRENREIMRSTLSRKVPGASHEIYEKYANAYMNLIEFLVLAAKKS